MGNPMTDTGELIPRPDPTKLTTDAVDRAKAEIEKLFDIKLDALHDLMIEKFSGRDTALAAALKSANELQKQTNESNTLASDKMSASFAKQIEGLDGKIVDLKDRVAEQAGKNWSTVGAYIFGAFGIAALVAAALIHH
jgi:hypothetical protein